MEQIINGKLYDTSTADLIADDKYWDGHNWDRQGRSKSLFKTKKGNYFMFYETRWQGEKDNIHPISKEEAKQEFENLSEIKQEFEDAFNEKPEIA